MANGVGGSTPLAVANVAGEDEGSTEAAIPLRLNVTAGNATEPAITTRDATLENAAQVIIVIVMYCSIFAKSGFLWQCMASGPGWKYTSCAGKVWVGNPQKVPKLSWTKMRRQKMPWKILLLPEVLHRKMLPRYQLYLAFIQVFESRNASFFSAWKVGRLGRLGQVRGVQETALRPRLQKQAQDLPASQMWREDLSWQWGQTPKVLHWQEVLYQRLEIRFKMYWKFIEDVSTR